MAESTVNAYNYRNVLHTNEGATAAVVEILTSACSAGDETNKTALLNWGLSEGNFKS